MRYKATKNNLIVRPRRAVGLIKISKFILLFIIGSTTTLLIATEAAATTTSHRTIANSPPTLLKTTRKLLSQDEEVQAIDEEEKISFPLSEGKEESSYPKASSSKTAEETTSNTSSLPSLSSSDETDAAKRSTKEAMIMAIILSIVCFFATLVSCFIVIYCAKQKSTEKTSSLTATADNSVSENHNSSSSSYVTSNSSLIPSQGEGENNLLSLLRSWFSKNTADQKQGKTLQKCKKKTTSLDSESSVAAVHFRDEEEGFTDDDESDMEDFQTIDLNGHTNNNASANVVVVPNSEATENKNINEGHKYNRDNRRHSSMMKNMMMMGKNYANIVVCASSSSSLDYELNEANSGKKDISVVKATTDEALASAATDSSVPLPNTAVSSSVSAQQPAESHQRELLSPLSSFQREQRLKQLERWRRNEMRWKYNLATSTRNDEDLNANSSSKNAKSKKNRGLDKAISVDVQVKKNNDVVGYEDLVGLPVNEIPSVLNPPNRVVGNRSRSCGSTSESSEQLKPKRGRSDDSERRSKSSTLVYI